MRPNYGTWEGLEDIRGFLWLNKELINIVAAKTNAEIIMSRLRSASWYAVLEE